MWDDINYPYPNFNGCTIEVWEWISNFIPHYTRCVITCPCWDLSQSMLVKWAPGGVYVFQTVIIMYLVIPNYWIKSIWILNKLQSSAVLTRSNITWYCIHHCNDWSRIQIRIWIPKIHPIPHPNKGAKGVSFVRILEKICHVLMAPHCISIRHLLMSGLPSLPGHQLARYFDCNTFVF